MRILRPILPFCRIAGLFLAHLGLTWSLFATTQDIQTLHRHPDYAVKGILELNRHYSFSIAHKPTGKAQWVSEGRGMGELTLTGYDPVTHAIFATVGQTAYVLWLDGASASTGTIAANDPAFTGTASAAAPEPLGELQINPRIRPAFAQDRRAPAVTRRDSDSFANASSMGTSMRGSATTPLSLTEPPQKGKYKQSEISQTLNPRILPGANEG